MVNPDHLLICFRIQRRFYGGGGGGVMGSGHLPDADLKFNEYQLIFTY